MECRNLPKKGIALCRWTPTEEQGWVDGSFILVFPGHFKIERLKSQLSPMADFDALSKRSFFEKRHLHTYGAGILGIEDRPR